MIDLDSLTSALLFAYLRSTTSSKSSSSTDLCIPLINLGADDVSLRREFTTVLACAEIEPSLLLTLDDIPSFTSISSLLKPENTRWFLVDHNVFLGELGKLYSSRISGVIDHHEEENLIPKTADIDPRIVRKAGSCTSLVTNYFRSAWDGLSRTGSQEDNESRQWDAEMAQVALASILIDTRNLQSSNTTTVDRDASTYLMSKIGRTLQPLSNDSKTRFDQEAFFQEVSQAKQNLDPLTLPEILRKDFKQWSASKSPHTDRERKLGISSVVKSLDYLYRKAREDPEGGFNRSICRLVERGDLEILAIMTSFYTPEGNHRRELLVYGRNQEGVQIIEQFLTVATKELGLEEWQGQEETADGLKTDLQALNQGNGECRWFRQRKAGQNRKIVAPMLRRAFEMAAS